MATNSQTIPIPIPVNGVIANQNPRTIGATGLVDAKNFLYRNGKFRSRPGLYDKTASGYYFDNDDSTPERPLGITSFGSDQATSITVIGTDTGWWKFVPGDGTLVDITDRDNELTGDDDDHVIFRSIDASNPEDGGAADTYLLGTNGNDIAKYWESTDSEYSDIQNTYPGNTDNMIAKCMTVSFDRVVYGNVKIGTDIYPDAIIYTEYLKFNEWNPINIIRLADTQGYIVGMLEYGNRATAIYKTDAIYLLSAIGQPNAPFRLDLKVSGIAGPVSSKAVVQVDGFHVYLASDGDVVMFDGSQARSLGAHLQAYFQQYMDFGKQGLAFGFYNSSKKELHFYFAGYSDDYVKNGVIINMSNPSQPTLWPIRFEREVSAGNTILSNETPTWGSLSPDANLGSMTGSIGSYGSYEYNPILCTPRASSAEGKVYYLSGYTDDGDDIEVYARTGWYDLGEVRMYKTIKEIDHLFKQSPGQELDIQLYVSISGETSNLSNQQTISLTTPPFITYHRDTGRLISLVISGDVSAYIEWLGSEATAKGRGRR
jgi:hypothetical protein